MDAATAGGIVVIAIRLLLPLAVFRWQFAGGLLGILADTSDVFVETIVGRDLFEQYHNVDKALDTYYLALEAIVASRWVDPLARWTAVVLFAARLAAVVLFEVTGTRSLFLFVGPNVFENFYLFVAAMRSVDGAYRIGSKAELVAIVALVGAPKLLQEYVMHYQEAQTWDFVKNHVLTPGF